jgi:hypothetical protein
MRDCYVLILKVPISMEETPKETRKNTFGDIFIMMYDLGVGPRRLAKPSVSLFPSCDEALGS